MNRRNLFKLLASAACSAAIEITGVIPKMPKVKMSPMVDYIGEIMWVNHWSMDQDSNHYARIIHRIIP